MGRLALDEKRRPQRYVRKEGNLSYSSGNTGNQQIGQTAYLTSLDLISLLTATTTAGAPAGTWGTTLAGAFAPIANVQVRVNGARAPFSLPGYHTDLFTQVWDQDYSSSLTTNPLVTSSTNNIVNHLRIPLTIDPISERGAWYTGDTALNLVASVTWNAASAAFSANAPTWAGSMDLFSEKFEAPQPDLSVDDTSGNWLDKISFFNQTQLFNQGQALSNGTTSVTLEVDQDFVRIVLVFYTGADNAIAFLPADGLYTTLSLRINDVANIWDTVSEARIRFEQAITYERTLPAGTAVLDFMRNRPPTRRDILPTDANIAKRLTLQIASTSSSNFVDVITQTVTDNPFAQRWVNLARAQAKR